MSEIDRAPRAKTPKALGFSRILYVKTGWRATVTINRPAVMNALDFLTLRELAAAFEDAAWDDGIAVVVVTGAGDRAFCTGADLAEQKAFLKNPGDYRKWMGAFIDMHDRLRNIGKPVIARLNGIVVGGGNELNVACDLAVAADDIYIRHVGPARGSVPAGGATQWLPLVIGDRRAREMLLLCEEVSAAQALEWGLVNRVVPRRDLDKTVDRLARRLYETLPEVVRYTKQQLNFWRDLPWALTVGHAREWLTLHADSAEVSEGLSSFEEKRPVDYRRLRGAAPAGRRKSAPRRGR